MTIALRDQLQASVEHEDRIDRIASLREQGNALLREADELERQDIIARAHLDPLGLYRPFDDRSRAEQALDFWRNRAAELRRQLTEAENNAGEASREWDRASAEIARLDQ